MKYQAPKLENFRMSYQGIAQGESLPPPDCSIPIKAPTEAELVEMQTLMMLMDDDDNSEE